MDHQAFAQLLGNYGEFFGSIAVFATLAYLAVQVRQAGYLTLPGVRQWWDASGKTQITPRFAEYLESIQLSTPVENCTFVAVENCTLS